MIAICRVHQHVVLTHSQEISGGWGRIAAEPPAERHWGLPSVDPSHPQLIFKCLFLLLLVLSLGLPISASADEASERLAKFNEPLDRGVEKGLTWLKENQLEDGSFPGQYGETTAVPALAGMAFLSKGYTPGLGPYGDTINRCIDYVLTYEKEKGDEKTGYLVRGGADKMYSHCIATLFLSEVSGMVDPERQQKIDEVLARALRVIVKAQQIEKSKNHAGGWRYTPDAKDSDLSLTGWAVMAIRSARLNGANIPEKVVVDAVDYILKCQKGKGFGYQAGGGEKLAMTGVGVLCLSLCGQHEHESLPKAGQYLLSGKENPGNQGHPYYAEYYCAQAMFQLGDDYWIEYAEAMYPRLLQKQSDDGSWSNSGYATAMSILAMTVHYRQLPVYQR